MIHHLRLISLQLIIQIPRQVLNLPLKTQNHMVLLHNLRISLLQIGLKLEMHIGLHGLVVLLDRLYLYLQAFLLALE